MGFWIGTWGHSLSIWSLLKLLKKIYNLTAENYTTNINNKDSLRIKRIYTDRKKIVIYSICRHLLNVNDPKKITMKNAKQTYTGE